MGTGPGLFVIWSHRESFVIEGWEKGSGSNALRLLDNMPFSLLKLYIMDLLNFHLSTRWWWFSSPLQPKAPLTPEFILTTGRVLSANAW